MTAMPINLRVTGSVMVVEGVAPLARMEINVPLTASALSINSISITSGTVAGDLVINGTLIANEFKTTVVSASIIYRSGSTKQGDSLDDVHEVTGSLRVFGGITGSLSGTFFGATQGSVTGTEGLTGSLQRLVSGLTYLVGGTRILITTQSNGQVLIDAVAADVSASYVTIGNTGSLPNERALIAGTGILLYDGGPGNIVSASIDDNKVATLSGSTYQGPLIAGYGLSGSLQRLDTGQSYLIGGPHVSVTTQSNGQVVVSGEGIADVSASYVTLGSTGSLPNERVLSASFGLSMQDNGAGSSIVLSLQLPLATVLSDVTASAGLTLVDATAGAVNVCLPNATQNQGKPMHVKKVDATANFVNVGTVDGVTQLIDGQATQSFNAQWTVLSVIASGSNWYIV